MTENTMDIIAKALHLDTKDGMVYGKAETIFIVIKNAPSETLLHINTGDLSSDQQKEIFYYLNHKREKYCIYGEPQYCGNYLDIRINAEPQYIINTTKDILSFLISFGVKSACTACGKAEGLPVCTAKEITYLCGGCAALSASDVQGHTEKANAGESYLRGFLGALLGGVIGIIPWAVLGFAGAVSALSGLVMAWLVVKLYLARHGKIGKPMVLIVIGTLIVFTILGVYTSAVVNAIQLGLLKSSFNGDFFRMIAYTFSPDFDIGTLSWYVCIGLVLAALGAFVTLRHVIKVSAKPVVLHKSRL